MKANTKHFEKFLQYLRLRGVEFSFSPDMFHMVARHLDFVYGFEIPSTIEGFDNLTNVEFPSKLGLSPCRFCPSLANCVAA